MPKIALINFICEILSPWVSQSDLLRDQIHSSLEKAQGQKSTLKRNNFRHTTANIILSALAAFLAGTAGTLGNQAGTWKITCLLAAAFSAGAAATAKMQTAEQLTEASECVGQLKALKVETITPTYNWSKSAKSTSRSSQSSQKSIVNSRPDGISF